MDGQNGLSPVHAVKRNQCEADGIVLANGDESAISVGDVMELQTPGVCQITSVPVNSIGRNKNPFNVIAQIWVIALPKCNEHVVGESNRIQANQISRRKTTEPFCSVR